MPAQVKANAGIDKLNYYWMDYRYHNITDFAADHAFIQWVKKPTAESQVFWDNWLKAHPEKKEIVLEAHRLVVLLSQDGDVLQEEELEAIWQHLTLTREQEKASAERKVPVLPFQTSRKKRSLVAAAFGLFLLFCGAFFFMPKAPATVAYATQFGEKKTVRLPDNSVVVLNGHSKITIPATWNAEQDRAVELEGEAFFKVTHQANDQKFLVNTKNGMQVEVLGTEFCVTNRKGLERVVLASGKVRLALPKDLNTGPLYLLPGQLVEVAARNKKVVQKKVEPHLYTAWKDNKLIFDNTALKDIAIMLEYNYGLPVVFTDSTIANRRMTASLEIEKLDDILTTLSETFDLEIKKESGKIVVKNI
ncbi:MAG: hypothetical protein COW65_08950 [Cytophagales bacterium CG18_big_fil_WC_8_21_14_2_50_42_9]|nr:MAG: hypothetical protein COW65_08950 [Cytophagales bacterium CG18_big_fil_WC_8_21_14_2_50_42_9]